MAALLLAVEGYTALDPSHPLGGRDGGKDATCRKDGRSAVMAVYFPRGQQSFKALKKKFVGDLAGRRFVGQFERLGPEPLRGHHGDQRIGEDALDGGVRSEVFESAHSCLLVGTGVTAHPRVSGASGVGLPWDPFNSALQNIGWCDS